MLIVIVIISVSYKVVSLNFCFCSSCFTVSLWISQKWQIFSRICLGIHSLLLLDSLLVYLFYLFFIDYRSSS